MAVVEGLVKELNEQAKLRPLLEHLTAASHLHGASDLAEARKAFHGFSKAATAVLEPLRGQEGMPKFAIFECPMIDEAVEGAPKKGRWIQAANRAIANPFFGEAMSKCGVEVQP